MCTLRSLIFSAIYLGCSGLLVAGILQFPPRPSVVSSAGVTHEEASKAIDAQYNDIVKYSNALKYLIGGMGGIICTIVIQRILRRNLQRIRSQPLTEAPRIVVRLPQALPPQKALPPSWVEKAYIDSKKRSFPHLLL